MWVSIILEFVRKIAICGSSYKLVTLQIFKHLFFVSVPTF
ncbi:hypothetical protein LEP1GSC074_0313 [Leptospira noguchii str. Hook]|nr:hypothetical protein LEP1GSC074_0313 [Leptospira noguchii str. Hook]